MRVEPTLELLDPALLARRDISRAIEDVVAAVGASMGWHYWLDIAWIVSTLERAGFAPGATIMDAGAGTGALQFVLARRGFRVVSLDYAHRPVSTLQRALFAISETTAGHFESEYIRHIERLKGGEAFGARLARRARKAVQLAVLGPGFLFDRWTRGGSIEYRRADMTDLASIPSGTIDAVVSVSAIEHVERTRQALAVSELRRTLKPEGAIVCTTSAAATEDWYHEPSQGWCFSRASLVALFGLAGMGSGGWSNYQEALRKLKDSDELRERMPQHYRLSGTSGMPWGAWDPQYVPVGIIAKANPS